MVNDESVDALLFKEGRVATATLNTVFSDVHDFALRYARNHSFSFHDAQDFAQDMALHIFSKVQDGKYTAQHEAKFSTWCGACIYHGLVDIVRKNNAQKTILSQDEGDHRAFFSSYSHEGYESKDYLAVLKNHLSNEEWNLLEQRASGYTYQELAQTTQKSSKALRTKVSRTRDKIKLLANQSYF